MARRRVRATGCGKFFIVMLILVPVAFVGASLFTGQNPISAFNELIGRDGKADQVDNSTETPETESGIQLEDKIPPSSQSSNPKQLKALESDVLAKDRKIERLESQLDLLEKELDKCQQKVQQLEN